MTIEEAIRHCKEVAKEQEKLYRVCPASESDRYHCDGTKDCKTLKNGKNKGCQKCAAEHRQLAEWLKELKQLREQEPCEDSVSRKEVIDTIYAECSGEKLDIDFAKVLLLQRAIKTLPSVKSQPKTGHWIDYSEEGFVECPECGIGLQDWHRVERDEDDDISFHEYEFRYCPNCGAKMESEE